jgi:8-oxo-dGTP pyrophosphatase MutT (NUDIX family)
MHRNDLIFQLENYAAGTLMTPDEFPVLEQFLTFVRKNIDCFERSNRGHVTGSAWIVNHDMSQVLLTHHKKLNMWIQLGGHADGDPLIRHVALKEAHEESGIEGFTFLTPGIFDIDIHPIPNACEYHYDVRYLLQAPEGALFHVSDESNDLAWVDRKKIREYSSKKSLARMMQKLNTL